MADPNLTESAWQRAAEVSARVYRTTEFGVAATLMTIIFGSVAAVASAGQDTTTQIAAPILGGALALALTFAVLFVVQLAAAPVRQRNELRAHWPRPGAKPVEKPVNVELTLRNERRRGSDLKAALSNKWSTTTFDEQEAETWTSGVVQFLNEHVDEAAVKEFIEASREADGLSEQLEARISALDEIIEGLGVSAPKT